MVYAVILMILSLVLTAVHVLEMGELAGFIDYQWWHYLTRFWFPACLMGNGIWKLVAAIKEHREQKKFLDQLSGPKTEE